MRFLQNPSHILANSILGIIAFLILDLFGFGIPINIIGWNCSYGDNWTFIDNNFAHFGNWFLGENL